MTKTVTVTKQRKIKPFKKKGTINTNKIKKVLIGGALLGASTYGLYKLAPLIKQKLQERNNKSKPQPPTYPPRQPPSSQPIQMKSIKQLEQEERYIEPKIDYEEIDKYTKILIKELGKSKVAIKGHTVQDACRAYNDFMEFVDKTCQYTGQSLASCRERHIKEWGIDFQRVIKAANILGCKFYN